MRRGHLRRTIVLHRLPDEPGTGLSPTASDAPRGARRAFGRAVEAQRRGDADAALAGYQEAVRRFPDYAPAWQGWGLLRLESGDVEGARWAFLRAVEADPDYLWPYAGLATVAAERRDWPAVERWASKLIELAPRDSPGAHYLRAIALLASGELSAAREAAERAESMGWGAVDPRLDELLAELAAVEH